MQSEKLLLTFIIDSLRERADLSARGHQAISLDYRPEELANRGDLTVLLPARNSYARSGVAIPAPVRGSLLANEAVEQGQVHLQHRLERALTRARHRLRSHLTDDGLAESFLRETASFIGPGEESLPKVPLQSTRSTARCIADRELVSGSCSVVSLRNITCNFLARVACRQNAANNSIFEKSSHAACRLRRADNVLYGRGKPFSARAARHAPGRHCNNAASRPIAAASPPIAEALYVSITFVRSKR